MNSSEDNAFKHFLKPFDETFEWLSKQSDPNHPQVVRKTIGICRDLRGICQTCTKADIYGEFFDWFHGKHFGTYLLLFEVLSITPEAAIPMLRLLEEFVFNRGSRLNFDPSSTNPHELFRSTQKAISTYGSRLSEIRVDAANTENDLYKIKSFDFLKY